MEIWLIRHTTPKIEKGICYGQLNLDVQDSFEQEAQAINQLVPTKEFSSVYTSPLKRCSKLAEHLFAQQTIIKDERLMELNFGDWEGKAWNSIAPKHLDVWGNNFLTQSPPNGECFNEMLNRANSFSNELESNEREKVAIVTHSGIIRAFLVKYLNIPALKVFNLELNYGAVIQIKVHSSEYQQVKFIKG